MPSSGVSAAHAVDVGIAEQRAEPAPWEWLSPGYIRWWRFYATFIKPGLRSGVVRRHLYRAPVTFVLDQARNRPRWGKSRHVGYNPLGIVPTTRSRPRATGNGSRTLLSESLAISDGPSVVRFSSGAIPEILRQHSTVGTVELRFAPATIHLGSWSLPWARQPAQLVCPPLACGAIAPRSWLLIQRWIAPPAARNSSTSLAMVQQS